MKHKINGYSIDFLKRQAKNLKKSEGIPYYHALNKAAISAGFSCWNNVINQVKGLEISKSLLTPSKQLSTFANTNNQKKLVRMNPLRKLLIAAINELLVKNLISLDGKDHHENDAGGYVFVELFGYPTVIMWCDIGFQELRISVWWKYDHSLHPQANLTGNSKESFTCSSPLAKRQHYRKFVGVTASGWLERKAGKYLQGVNNRGIFDIYTRNDEKAELEKLPIPIPKGFQGEGEVYI